MNPKYSFVIPVYNEEENLQELFVRMNSLMKNLDGDSEILFIDDGSSDASPSLMCEMNKMDKRFKVIQFSRNFGHQFAITAGLDLAQGEAVIVMDADLQDDPQVCHELINEWKNGYEIVYAVRKSRLKEGLFKRVTAYIFYRLLLKLSDTQIPVDTGDFRCIDRKALEAFKRMREHGRYVRGMFSWLGFKQKGVYYTRKERFSGVTKFSFSKMINFAIDGILAFSKVPLRVVLKFGIAVSLLSFMCGIGIIVLKITGFGLIPGWASIVVSIFFIAGIQFVILGIMSEYIGHIYDEVKNRPLYIIKNIHGFKNDSK